MVSLIRQARMSDSSPYPVHRFVLVVGSSSEGDERPRHPATLGEARGGGGVRGTTVDREVRRLPANGEMQHAKDLRHVQD
jgi:hypothetical protein